jgi:hypothetical protein
MWDLSRSGTGLSLSKYSSVIPFPVLYFLSSSSFPFFLFFLWFRLSFPPSYVLSAPLFIVYSLLLSLSYIPFYFDFPLFLFVSFSPFFLTTLQLSTFPYAGGQPDQSTVHTDSLSHTCLKCAIFLRPLLPLQRSLSISESAHPLVAVRMNKFHFSFLCLIIFSSSRLFFMCYLQHLSHNEQNGRGS